jgi:hypothetical protein
MTYTPGESNTILENQLQGEVAREELFYMAKVFSRSQDTRPGLEQLGFKIVGENDLFYICTPPEGATKATEGYWTSFRIDEKEVVTQFYKASPWDTEVFLNFC